MAGNVIHIIELDELYFQMEKDVKTEIDEIGCKIAKYNSNLRSIASFINGVRTQFMSFNKIQITDAGVFEQKISSGAVTLWATGQTTKFVIVPTLNEGFVKVGGKKMDFIELYKCLLSYEKEHRLNKFFVEQEISQYE